MNSENEVILVAGCMRLIREIFPVFLRLKQSTSRKCCENHDFYFLWRLLAAVIWKRLFALLLPLPVDFVEQILRLSLCFLRHNFLLLLFQVYAGFDMRSVYKDHSVSRYSSYAAVFSIQQKTYSTVFWLNRCLKL